MLRTRRLGKLTVSSIGLGCMGFSHGYGPTPEKTESIRLMRLAYEEFGCTLFDTAEVYGTFANETLVGKAIKPIRDKIVLTTKFMPLALPGQDYPEGKLSRKGLRSALEGSLKRLQTDHIDLYYEHRVPIESDPAEIAGWMGELIAEGKILAWGMSEPTVEQLRIAHAITPVTSVQNEYSMMQRRAEQGMLETCEELGIGFESYSPLAGGFLSGKYTASTIFTGDDVRRVITRFAKENITANQPLLDLLEETAKEDNATPAQIALRWLLKKKPWIVPICGMRSESRMKENFGADCADLSNESFERLEKALSCIKIFGDRKDSDIAKLGTVKSVCVV